MIRTNPLKPHSTPQELGKTQVPMKDAKSSEVAGPTDSMGPSVIESRVQEPDIRQSAASVALASDSAQGISEEVSKQTERLSQRLGLSPERLKFEQTFTEEYTNTAMGMEYFGGAALTTATSYIYSDAEGEKNYMLRVSNFGDEAIGMWGSNEARPQNDEWAPSADMPGVFVREDDDLFGDAVAMAPSMGKTSSSPGSPVGKELPWLVAGDRDSSI